MEEPQRRVTVNGLASSPSVNWCIHHRHTVQPKKTSVGNFDQFLQAKILILTG